MIRQLTKTNVVLGGQIEWRFVLGYNNGELVIKDFHIAPISPNIIYNNHINETTLNYKHRDNIRKLYNKIKGNFFSIKTTPILNTDYPIHTNDTESPITATMEQQYEMGARRENMSLYGKQFSFFCPFWMDDKNDVEGLRFVFCATSPKTQLMGEVSPQTQVMYTDTTSLLNPNNEGTKIILEISKDRNQEIYNYIKQWTDTINLNTDLLNINLHDHTATLCGIDCESGDLITKNVYNIINDLTYRERPMLEQMNMLMKLFSDNHIICKQLFNFRFYFDLEDIIHTPDATSLYNKPFVYSVWIKPKTGAYGQDGINSGFNKLWDFFSNFEFLNKKRIDINHLDTEGHYKEDMSSIDGTYNTNALVYLRDNECIDIIHENKINQQTCYWRLLENPNQIFNFYKGLNYDVYDNDNLIGNNDGMFDKTPMMSTTAPNPGLFTCNWVNFYAPGTNYILARKLSPGGVEWDDFKFTNYIKDKYTKVEITPDSKIVWMDLLKLDLTRLTDEERALITGEGTLTIYFATIWYTNQGLNSTFWKNEETNTYVVGILSDVNEKLTLKYFMDNTSTIINDGALLEILKLLIKCIVKPDRVLLTRTLQYTPADGPTPFIKELKYIKDNECKVQLYRHGGNLYPMFIEAQTTPGSSYHNFQYWVRQFVNYEELGAEYSQLLQTKYKPLYPSIGYDSLEKMTSIPYYTYIFRTFRGDTRDDYTLVPEYQWFQAGMLKKIPEEIIVEDNRVVGETLDGGDLLEKFTQEFFLKIPTEDLIEYVRKYIIELYKREITLESKYEDGVIRNYYIIKYTLK